MAQDPPDRQELRRGMTVRVVQEQDNNDGEPLIGDIRQIVGESDDPPGVVVETESDVTGRVIEVVTDEREDELTE